MAKKLNLGDLHAAIESIYRDVMKEQGNGVVPNSIVLDRLTVERSALVQLYAPQLINMALTKLLNDVCRKNATRATSHVHDLFDGYRKIPMNVTVGRGFKKATEKLTILEAQEYLDNHLNRTSKNDYLDFRHMVDECREHARSSSETIEDVLVRLRGGVVRSPTLDLDTN